MIAIKKEKILNDKELLILNKIKMNQKIEAGDIVNNLLELGLIESLGQKKYTLSKQYYRRMDKRGEYTRKRGLDKETNKSLILDHLKKWKKGYMYEFRDVFKGELQKSKINMYLDELKKEDKIELIGNPQAARGKNAAYWKLK